ncbi:MAG TPA: hypothetical protein VN843_09355 [Anaerolineales bacterium]|nr:hypothetical protein [Anaerolineales bacterium]
MASKSSDINLITFSVRVYQALLNAYPAKFQQEYGSEMTQVFQDCCLRAIRKGGMNGMLKLWAVTFLDLIQSVISEHAHKEIEMKKEMDPEIIRLAGGALIWGAMTFVIGMFLAFLSKRGANFWAIADILVLFISMPLFVVGLLGLRNRYGERAGWFGKNILLIGVIVGALISLLGFFGGANEASWSLMYSGPAVLLAGLTLFGFVALYKKPLPRWNVAPVLAGIGYPTVSLISTMGWDVSIGVNVAILFGIQGIALAALGYVLRSDVPKETALPT